MTFIGKSVQVVGTGILESDPLAPPLPNGQPSGEFTIVPSGKVFPAVDKLMIQDGLTYVVWDNLFNAGTYVMALDSNIKAIPPVQGNVTYAGLSPWILKGEAVVTPKQEATSNWVWLLLAGLFLLNK